MITVGLLAGLYTLFVAGQAQAAVRTGWCDSIPFADTLCDVVSNAREVYEFASDPIGYLAAMFHDAVAFVFGAMMNALLSTTRIDWSDAGFLRTYGMAFAVSSVLTVILWLIAVAKRVIQGTPALQAVTESIGFLLLSVVATALAPAAIAYVTELFDRAAEAMFAPVADDGADLVVTVSAAMAALMVTPGGPIIVSFLALALLAAVSGVWMILIIRDALILSGLIFGATVFSGLVDRSLWSHVKRWVGVMGAIIASKYVVLTTIALATGMLASDAGGETSIVQSFATVFTAIALLWLALYLPFQLSKFLPLLGDDIQGLYQARDEFTGRAQNLGAKGGDTFRELSGRFGGEGGEGEGADAAGGGADAEAGVGGGEAAASATGVGAIAVAGKKTVDAAEEHVERTAERGVETATQEESADSKSRDSGVGSPDIPPSPAPPERGQPDGVQRERPDTATADPWADPPETAPPPDRGPGQRPQPTAEPESDPPPQPENSGR
ncbi:hypothetical protein ACWGIB_23675 [Streptomyces xiamenensis]